MAYDSKFSDGLNAHANIVLEYKKTKRRKKLAFLAEEFKKEMKSHSMNR